MQPIKNKISLGPRALIVRESPRLKLQELWANYLDVFDEIHDANERQQTVIEQNTKVLEVAAKIAEQGDRAAARKLINDSFDTSSQLKWAQKSYEAACRSAYLHSVVIDFVMMHPEEPLGEKVMGWTRKGVHFIADPYETLGLERGATEDEIKQAYRELALKYHPDHNEGGTQKTDRAFARVQVAYEQLIK